MRLLPTPDGNYLIVGITGEWGRRFETLLLKARGEGRLAGWVADGSSTSPTRPLRDPGFWGTIHSMKNEPRTRAIAFILVLAVCLSIACSASQLAGRRLADLTATPTKTLRPTFTPTPSPTSTPAPSPTPVPSATPLPTAVPTEPPPPTAAVAPSPIPTDTPPPPTALLPPTATRKPTPKPTRTRTPTPRPTNTPAPPFTGKIVRGFANCGWAGVEGFVKHTGGTPYPGVALGTWSADWDGRVAISDGSGKISLPLTGLPAGTFNVAVVRIETCGGNADQPTAADCQRLSNVLVVSVTAKCSGSGANQVTIVDFTGQ